MGAGGGAGAVMWDGSVGLTTVEVRFWVLPQLAFEFFSPFSAG